MAIEIVDLPIENGESFHSFLYVYQAGYCKLSSLLCSFLIQTPKARLKTAFLCLQNMCEKPTGWISTILLPSGKHTKTYGKSPFLMGNFTINGHFQ